MINAHQHQHADSRSPSFRSRELSSAAKGFAVRTVVLGQYAVAGPASLVYTFVRKLNHCWCPADLRSVFGEVL